MHRIARQARISCGSCGVRLVKPSTRSMGFCRRSESADVGLRQDGARRRAMRRLWLLFAFATFFALPGLWGAEVGESIYAQGVPGKVPACAVCHGPRGEGGGEGLFPRLAGQPAAYLEAQLKAFRDGKRSSAVMAPTVAAMSDAEVSAVAAFLSRERP